MFFWMNYALMNILEVVIGLFFAIVMEPRWKRIPRWVYAVCLAVSHAVPGYLKITNTGTMISTVMQYIILTTIIIYIIVFFRDKLWKKLLLFLLLNCIIYISEIITRMLMEAVNIPYNVSYNNKGMFLYIVCDGVEEQYFVYYISGIVNLCGFVYKPWMEDNGAGA